MSYLCCDQICCDCNGTINGPPVRLDEDGQIKDFCSVDCMQTFIAKDGVNQSTQTPPALKSPAVGKTGKREANLKFQYETYATSFVWDEYLEETSSVSAPPHCFKQVRFSP